jgi:hypothetical protein
MPVQKKFEKGGELAFWKKELKKMISFEQSLNLDRPKE